MTSDSLIAHVEQSVARALRHDSGIDASILDLKGFSTGVQRRLVNNLCRLPDNAPVYLEIGLYAGATFCSAMSNNPKLSAIGVENFSQPFGDDTIRAQLEANVVRHRGDAFHVELIDADCWTMDRSAIPFRAVDLFYFDGEHSEASQARALPHFIEHMAAHFVFMVDDTNWPEVARGTAMGFETLRDFVKIEHHRHLSDAQKQDGPNWHNGVDLYVCSRL